jgi:hypothetical protein
VQRQQVNTYSEELEKTTTLLLLLLQRSMEKQEKSIPLQFFLPKSRNKSQHKNRHKNSARSPNRSYGDDHGYDRQSETYSSTTKRKAQESSKLFTTKEKREGENRTARRSSLSVLCFFSLSFLLLCRLLKPAVVVLVSLASALIFITLSSCVSLCCSP